MSGRRAPRSRRRLVAATAVAVIAAPVAAATLAAPAALADSNAPTTQGRSATGELATFNGQAAADGVRATIAVKDYLIVEDFVDGGGPTAQAALDSLGESTAFSSLPYPGATGVAFPGLVSTLSGKSVPSYPFIVNSQFPSNPKAEVKQPGYLMRAESSETRSVAQTEAGATTTSGEEFGSFSVASVSAADGVLTSLGEARSRLAIGALALNGAVSRAQVTSTADGKTTKTSSFEASSLRIGGMQFGVTDQGLVLGPQGAPLDPARQVEEAITSSGVTVKFLPAIETADSVLSSGLEISMARPIPNVGSANAVVSYIVGRTFAQAAATGAAGVGTAGTTTPATSPGLDTSVPATPATGVPAAVAPVGSGPLGIVPAAPGGELPAAGTPGAVAAPATVNLVTATAQRDLTEVSFYPLLAAAVPILLLAAVGARRFI